MNKRCWRLCLRLLTEFRVNNGNNKQRMLGALPPAPQQRVITLCNPFKRPRWSALGLLSSSRSHPTPTSLPNEATNPVASLARRGVKGPCGHYLQVWGAEPHNLLQSSKISRCTQRSYLPRSFLSYSNLVPKASCQEPSSRATASERNCERGDSNPYALRHQILNLACLPISPLSRQLAKRVAGAHSPVTILHILAQDFYHAPRIP